MVQRPAFLRGVSKWTMCLFILAALLFVIGVCLFCFSWLVRYEIEKVVQDGIYDTIIVDSKDASGYQSWEDNYDHDHPLLYEQFFLYNLTNLAEIHAGTNTKIKVKQMGPYTYVAKKLKIDVEFMDHGNKVGYGMWNTFYFRPDLSCAGCTQEDVIHNINPAYLAAVSQAGGELEIIPAIAGPMIKANVFDFLWGTWVPDVIAEWRPPILKDAMNRAVAGSSIDTFYSTWANATNKNTGVWQALTISYKHNPSGISLESAQALFDGATPYSLLARDTESTRTWRRVQLGDATAQKQIGTSFGVSTDQVTMIANWLTAQFDPFLVHPNLTKSFDVETVEDLAYLQWGEGVVTGGVSVQTLYPEMNFTQAPELAGWYNTSMLHDRYVSLSYRTSKLLLGGPEGLFNAMSLADLIKSVESLDWYKIKTVWGLSEYEDMLAVTGYFADFAYVYSRAKLNEIVESGNGMFVNRTVYQWVMNVTDPLIALLQPENSQTALIVNETTIEFARKKNMYYVSLTGKDNVNKIGQYISWKNVTEVDIYGAPVKVTGVNDAGQFEPFLGDGTKLHAWDDNYIRDLELVPVKDVTIKGVKARRYEISNSTWDINPTYSQYIQGYVNMTGYEHGSPVFLTNPHMYLSDDKYFNKIEGVVRNRTMDTVIIDIEPNSGTVIHYYEGLQINVYLDPRFANMLTVYNGQLQYDYMVPVMIAMEFSELGNKDADKVKDQLYYGIKMESTMFWVFLGVGLGLVVLSVPACGGFVWKYRRDRSRVEGYSAVDHQVIQ
eukprot:TRINITY_DN4467_c1_g1_i1.p1 TRINITY_DN4467_c1_g1~~TRINITY_DN4467_c1_g1_i1.p1  ORF type:complete len:777 (+),score=97.03 TRINITY_DN4467_c1_g1_i1:148-2478(+)